MKSIALLSDDIMISSEKIINKIIQAQRKTAETIWEDVINSAPSNSGEYISSIQVSDTHYEKNEIRTKIFTDMKSEDGYVIGRMIENGTGIYALEPHIGHTKTFFASGYNYWYVPENAVRRAIGAPIFINGKKFYLAKAQPAKPHFKPSLERNIYTYKKNLSEAIKEAIK